MKSKQFLKEGFVEDAHEAHMDHEVQMARVDCYYAAEHAMVLHKLLRNISEEQGLEGWVAAKITLANDYLKSVREHLEYQMMSSDVDEDDFLPLAESTKYNKKKINEELSNTELQKFERGPWYIIISGQAVPDKDGTPKKFNWLNAAKMHFRSMLDDDPKVAAQLKSEYDKATDKKLVIYYSKKLPVSNNTNTQSDTTDEKVSETSNKPGLWANIRAKRERIKSGSGERMRAPGSKGAPSDKDLKSIRAASESTENANSTWYDNLTGKYPKTKLALDLLPPTAMATSAVDAINNLSKGNYGAAAIDAAGLLPGVKPLSKFLPKLLSIDNISRGRKVGKGTSTAKDVGDYIDSEFPHKVNESDFHSQFAAMIDDMKKSGKLKTGDSTKSNRNFKTPEPKSKEELMSRLKELEAEFDPAYQQSDDYSFWKKQNDIASEISSIKRQLRQQVVKEDLSKTDIKKQISKFEELALAANRAGDDEKSKQYQQKIQSLKQKMSQGVAKGDQLDEMNPMLVRDGLQVVIDFLSQYPTATTLTAGVAGAAAGTAIIAKLVKNAWKNHKELEQLKQDVINWSSQKLHANKNVAAKGGKVAKIIQAEIARRKKDVAEGLDPETTRLEQDVRNALENGDDYTAKQYAKMAPTPEAKKYLLNIIKQEMYGTDPDQGVAKGISTAAQQSFDNSDENWKAGYRDYMNGKGWKFPTARLNSREGKKYRAGWDEAERAVRRKREQGVAEGKSTYGDGKEMYVGIEAYGVRGMKSTPWRKKFKNQAAFEKWLDSTEGDVEVYGTREINLNDFPVKNPR